MQWGDAVDPQGDHVQLGRADWRILRANYTAASVAVTIMRERRNQATKQARWEPGFKPTWSGAGSTSPTRGHTATTPQE